MKLINRDTDYAIKALMHITKYNDEKPAVSEMAVKLDIPRPFLRKILQILNHEGVLNSYKGKGGGFQLARPPEKILVSDLIRIFQGPVKLNDCIFREKICPDIVTCPLRKKIQAMEDHVVTELKSTSLAMLLEGEETSQEASPA